MVNLWIWKEGLDLNPSQSGSEGLSLAASGLDVDGKAWV